MTRSYKLSKRGERQSQTRQKIIEAAIHLHQTKGVSATSMTDIADQAQVGKVTVYRHFPDLDAIVGACSGLYFERNPFPDAQSWRAVSHPTERLRLGLKEAYAWYRSTEAMMASVYREAKDAPIMEPYHNYWSHAVDTLLEPWPQKGKERKLLRAAIAFALNFETWQNLVNTQGLRDKEVIQLMLRLACDCPNNST
jgi:AcrR family transcriptional regulator